MKIRRIRGDGEPVWKAILIFWRKSFLSWPSSVKRQKHICIRIPTPASWNWEWSGKLYLYPRKRHLQQVDFEPGWSEADGGIWRVFWEGQGSYSVFWESLCYTGILLWLCHLYVIFRVPEILCATAKKLQSTETMVFIWNEICAFWDLLAAIQSENFAR